MSVLLLRSPAALTVSASQNVQVNGQNVQGQCFGPSATRGSCMPSWWLPCGTRKDATSAAASGTVTVSVTASAGVRALCASPYALLVQASLYLVLDAGKHTQRFPDCNSHVACDRAPDARHCSVLGVGKHSAVLIRIAEDGASDVSPDPGWSYGTHGISDTW